MTTAKAKAEPKETVQTDPVQEQVQPDPAESQTSTTSSTPEPVTDQSEPRPQLPSLGRVVHFVIDPELPNLAALVTEEGVTDPEGSVSLVIYKQHLQFFRQNVAYDGSGKKANTWHWPARV